MSVVLLIEHDDGRSDLVPVATEAIFSTHWQPLCRALGLIWVPLFQTGIPVYAADVDDILDELGRFLDVARSTSDGGQVAVCARGLIDALRAVDFDAVNSVFIG